MKKATMNEFVKSHGLGNSYIILDEKNIDFPLDDKIIRVLCNPDFGIGSDGILLKVDSDTADFGVRIFNPDGTEAEKSGNGIRIIAKYIFDYGFTDQHIFTIETLGGIVKAEIIKKDNQKAEIIKVELGVANFKTKEIPVKAKVEELFDYPLNIEGHDLRINCVSVGNPHCVIFTDTLDENLVRKLGPSIETHSLFPVKINVQFAKVINDSEIEILIWERGAGYTQASGSSSSATAAIAHKLGKVGNKVNILMPGGALSVSIKNDWLLELTGPVQEVAKGYLSKEFTDKNKS